MSAGDVVAVVAGVLCALAIAALAVALVRVGDALRQVRSELDELRATTDEARRAVVEARADLDRFDRVLGSAEAISGAVGRSSRVARTTLSVPMIKAAGLATGTSRAVRKLRRGA